MMRAPLSWESLFYSCPYRRHTESADFLFTWAGIGEETPTSVAPSSWRRYKITNVIKTRLFCLPACLQARIHPYRMAWALQQESPFFFSLLLSSSSCSSSSSSFLRSHVKGKAFIFSCCFPWRHRKKERKSRPSHAANERNFSGRSITAFFPLAAGWLALKRMNGN